MNEDTMKDIITDAHALFKAPVSEDILRAGIETIANRLEKLVEGWLYIPPKAALDALRENQPIGGEGPSLNQVMKDGLKMLRGEDRFGEILKVEWLGIKFRRFRSNSETVLVATWRNDETRDSHVYEIHVKRDGDTPNSGWIATCTNDGRRVFSLQSRNRTNCEQCALSAMKRYLSRGHRRVFRKRHRVAPLSPEAELAATVALQKEDV